MSADLHLEIARRNARLRAWRAHGAPVEGGWCLALHGSVKLSLRCEACPFAAGEVWAGPEHMEAVEHDEVSRLVRSCPCPSLAPLLGPDPEEVRNLTGLELLAGER